MKRNGCPVAKSLSEANRCPLCHTDIPPGMEGWKRHYLTGKGCPYNDRSNVQINRISTKKCWKSPRILIYFCFF